MIESLLRVDIVLFLTIGLLGGAHCIGMCGPLVTMYAERMQPRADGGRVAGTTSRGSRDAHLSPYEVRQHLLFNLGRTASYTVLGGLFGALGAVLFRTTGEFTAVAALVRGIVGVAIGALVVLVGLRYVLGRGAAGIQLPGLERVTTVLTGWVDRLAKGPGIAGLGAMHGLLPCPILYPAYLYAFASGSPLSGAVALAALGLGTIPAVLGYGTLIGSVDATHRKRLHRVLGVAFVVLGYVLLAHGAMALGVHLPHPTLPHYQPLGG